MSKFYKPPKFGERPGKPRSKRRKSVVPRHPPVWIVPLVRVDLDDEDRKAERESRAEATAKLSSSDSFHLDKFHWQGAEFINRLEEGHLVIPVVEESRRQKFVEPVCRVVHLKRYAKGRTRAAIVFLERPNLLRSRKASVLVSQVGEGAQILKSAAHPKQVRKRELVHALLNRLGPRR